jgi:hypothetical protein
VPVLIDPTVVGDATATIGRALQQQPVSSVELLRMYVWMPLVVASAGIAVMTPGLLLTVGRGQISVERAVLRSFALSLLLVSGAASAVQALLGVPVTGRSFLAVVAALSVAAVIVRRQTLSGLRLDRAGWGSVGLLAGVPIAMVTWLIPKIFFESFNGDGAHAFFTARLAVKQFLPFWDPTAGGVSGFPGVSTVLFAYPASWFVRLFGEFEAAVRLPYFLVLGVAYAAILAFAARARSLRFVDRVLVGLALVVYSVVQAFSSTYDPYSADLSMPGLPDTLQIVTFMGFVLAYLERNRGWMTCWLALALLSSPSGAMLVVFWLVAIVLVSAREERSVAVRTAVQLVGLVVALALLPAALGAAGLPVPGNEHALAGLLTRFAFLQFTDIQRVGWVAVASGLFPMTVWVAWRRTSREGRALLIVSALYFAMFYVQAHIMLHHFVPAMLLPLAAVWHARDWFRAPAAAAGAGLMALAAIWLSLPPSTQPIDVARVVGRTVVDRVGGRADLEPAAFRRAELLRSLFPQDYDPSVPAGSYGGSQLAWLAYSQQQETDSADINYVLVGPGQPPPVGARAVAQNDAGSLYVLNEGVLQAHKALRPPTPAGSRVFWTPRGILFRSVPLEDGPWILDVPELLRHLGIDVDGIAQRLGAGG